MNLKQLQSVLESFKEFLSKENYEYLQVWQSLKTYRDNWDISALDFKAMFERSFESTLANPLWEGNEFFPKRAILQFIERDDDLVRAMFKDLYNESLDIGGRVDRFVYHCDAIREDILKTTPRYQQHYHSDLRMISVYLAFKYPTQYAIFDAEAFTRFMESVSAKPPPAAGDIERFFKVARTVYKIASKDEELMALHRSRRDGVEDAYQDESLVLVSEVFSSSAKASQD